MVRERRVPASRSYADLTAGMQRYAVLESCTRPETLWEKLESGHWDWLGVEQRGDRITYLLGRPPISARGWSAVASTHRVGASGEHRVEVRAAGSATDQWGERHEFTSADARAAYRETIDQLLNHSEGSGVYKVRLYVDGRLAEEELVVRMLPNRL